MVSELQLIEVKFVPRAVKSRNLAYTPLNLDLKQNK